MLRFAFQQAVARPSTFDGTHAVPNADPNKVEQFFEYFLSKFLGYKRPVDVPAAAPALSSSSAAVGDEDNKSRPKRRKGNDGDDAAAVASAPPAAPAAATLPPCLPEDGPAVKPVVTSDMAALGAKLSSVHTFYGNKRIYVFFRVFSLLCSRLRRAKELQLNPGHAVWKPFNIIPPAAAASFDQQAEGAPAPEDKYGFLLADMRRLLAGEIDNTKFEDDLREKFGLHSYVLFTLDRLVYFLVRRLTSIVCGDESVKLLGLWEYEVKRNNNLGVLEPVYASNAREVVGQRGKLIRICFTDADKSSEEQAPLNGPSAPSDLCKALTVELLPSATHPQVVGLAKDYQEWSRYVHNFVKADVPSTDSVGRRVFLKRNLKASFPDLQSAHTNTVMSNQMRVRISLCSYRMFYVEGGEDVFFRPRSKAQSIAATNEKRGKKFQAWLSRLGLP